MESTLDFPDLLTLLDERSNAFRAAVAAAPDLDAQVPTCPAWTLHDLAEHIGEGRRSWAATVAAGPGTPGKLPAEIDPEAPHDRDALLEWLATSTRMLIDALREAGPDHGCWTWWAGSQSPQTCGAVARHQLQQLAVHTYDAQITVGDPQPLPQQVAVDGVDEFLSTCVAGPYRWPHEPATLDYHATEGGSWRVTLTAYGVRAERHPVTGEAQFSAHGTASDLVLAMYGRIPVDSLKVHGDRRVFDRLASWDPSQ